MNDESPTLAERLAGAQFELYAFIAVLMEGAPESADVLQETNLAILRHQEAYDSARPFLPWARGVARNRVLRFYRTRSRDRLVFDETLLDDLAARMPCDDVSEPLEALSHLERCLGRLIPKQREMVTARYMRGEAVKVIAARENCSENAISVLLHRVRQILADCVARETRRSEGVSHG